MKKKLKVASAAILVIVIIFLLDVFFGRWLLAWVSTQGFVKKYNLISPPTALVINTKEEIRVSDSNDVSAAAAKIQSTLSAVLMKSGNTLSFTGTAVNITEDGYFASVASVLPENGKEYWVQVANGEVQPITAVYADPVSKLVFFKADFRNLAIARFGQSARLEPGERIALVSASQTVQRYDLKMTYIHKSVSDVVGSIYNSSGIRNGVNVFTDDIASLPGAVGANKDSEIISIGDASLNYTGEQVSRLTQIFLTKPGLITRPNFGFTYKYVTPGEAKVFNKSQGLEIISVENPALAAGIKVGDIITEIGDKSIDATRPIEQVLSSADLGTVLKSKIKRGNVDLTIVLTPIPLTTP